ncbi:PepSY domain-containing protein [Rhizobium sp.]
MKLNPSHIAAVAASALFLFAAPITVSGYTAADANLQLVDAEEQDEVRAAVRAGLIRPLEEVLAEARKSIDGDIVEIEFDKDDDRYIYEIEYVRRDGQLMEMKIDAKTLAIIENDEED